MKYCIKIWSYDEWIERNIEADSKEQAANKFISQCLWMKTRRDEILDELREMS